MDGIIGVGKVTFKIRRKLVFFEQKANKQTNERTYGNIHID